MLPLRINMAPLQNVPVLRNIILDAGVVSKRTEWYDGDGPLPPEAIERMKSELGLGYWNFYGTLYGPPPMIEMYYGMIKEAFVQIPGAQFFTHEDRDEAADRGAHVLHDRHKINNGIPSLDEMKLLDFVPNGGHIGFSPVSAPDGRRRPAAVRDGARRAPTSTRKDYAAQFIVGLREMHHICLFLFDTADPTARQETLRLASMLVDEAAEEGYGEYRTHNALMDDVMGTFNWGDGALLKFHETDQGRPRPQRHHRARQVRRLGQEIPWPASSDQTGGVATSSCSGALGSSSGTSGFHAERGETDLNGAAPTRRTGVGSGDGRGCPIGLTMGSTAEFAPSAAWRGGWLAPIETVRGSDACVVYTSAGTTGCAPPDAGTSASTTVVDRKPRVIGVDVAGVSR